MASDNEQAASDHGELLRLAIELRDLCSTLTDTSTSLKDYQACLDWVEQGMATQLTVDLLDRVKKT